LKEKKDEFCVIIAGVIGRYYFENIKNHFYAVYILPDTTDKKSLLSGKNIRLLLPIGIGIALVPILIVGNDDV
jgi:hypothetical protein